MFNEWEIPLNIWTHYLPSTSHPIIRRSHHLSRQSEGKGEHFALDVVAEAIAVFDGPHTTLLGHADVEDLHDHKQVAAKARQLTTDNDVSFMDLASALEAKRADLDKEIEGYLKELGLA